MKNELFRRIPVDSWYLHKEAMEAYTKISGMSNGGHANYLNPDSLSTESLL